MEPSTFRERVVKHHLARVLAEGCVSVGAGEALFLEVVEGPREGAVGEELEHFLLVVISPSARSRSQSNAKESRRKDSCNGSETIDGFYQDANSISHFVLNFFTTHWSLFDLKFSTRKKIGVYLPVRVLAETATIRRRVCPVTLGHLAALSAHPSLALLAPPESWQYHRSSFLPSESVAC